MDFNKIIETIKSATSIAISAHTNPDGDAIGAMVAIGLLCKQLNKNYAIILQEYVSTIELFDEDINILYLTQTQQEEHFECFVALDCGNVDRLMGYNEYFTKAEKTIVIDHHITNTGYAIENMVVPQASSTCELVYECIEQSRILITQEIAKAIYMGIVTDTGGFMHSCTAPRTHEIAAKLIRTGIDFTAIYYKLLKTISYEALKLQGIVTSRLKKVSEKPIYMAYIIEEDLKSTHASKDDVATMVSFLKNIVGIECIAFIYPIANSKNYKLSMRANEPYDVATFCEQFGGGGHKLAAGATLEGTIEENIDKIENLLKMW